MFLKELVQSLTDEQLKLAFEEITEWKYNSGVLPEGIVREIHAKFEEKFGDNNLRVTEDTLLYEMAKRFASRI